MIQHPFLDSLREKIRIKNNRLAAKRIRWIKSNSYFYKQLINSLRFVIEPNSKVLNIRCSVGYILNELQPKLGVGIDDSSEQIEIAKKNYPHLKFFNLNPEELSKEQTLDEKFDYILVYSLEDIVDIKATLDHLKPFCKPQTRLIIIYYNFLWHPFVRFAEFLRLKIPHKLHNWVSYFDLRHLLALTRFELIKHREIVLYPYQIPLLSKIINQYLVHLPILRLFSFIRLMVARPIDVLPQKNHKVSVIVPCKNEEGNIEDAVKRIPKLGSHTEIIFCDDQSTDNTAGKVKEMIEKFPEKDIKLVEGPGICKAENVWVGFDAAQGDILMILDADLTVLPEELPYFYSAISEGIGEFINGSRLVYPMHQSAMRPFNVLGNKFFSELFSYILDTRIKDTLCGTKVLWKKDYERIKPLRGSWGVQDRWGDYELIFGAARRHLKIIDLPVHYTERTYGETKMTHRFKNAWTMFKMCRAGLKKIKFFG